MRENNVRKSQAQQEWEKYKEIVNKNENGFLISAIRQARANALEPIYHGVYLQATEECPQQPMRVPFVIGFEKNNIAKFKQVIKKGVRGIPLETHFFEIGESGTIEGVIDNKNINFIKQYTFSGSRPLEDIPVYCYTGVCQEDGTYQGTWYSDAEPAGVLQNGAFKIIEPNFVLVE